VRRGSLVAHAASQQVETVLQDTKPGAEYPEFSLAKQLKTVVELVRAELGIRIFFTELGGGGIGGFDNHANQRDNHAAVLRELSESVAAFVADLSSRGLLGRVLLMTFSEFGRTLHEKWPSRHRPWGGGPSLPGRRSTERWPGRRAPQPDRPGRRRSQVPHGLPPCVRHGSPALAWLCQRSRAGREVRTVGLAELGRFGGSRRLFPARLLGDDPLPGSFEQPGE